MSGTRDNNREIQETLDQLRGILGEDNEFLEESRWFRKLRAGQKIPEGWLDRVKQILINHLSKALTSMAKSKLIDGVERKTLDDDLPRMTDRLLDKIVWGVFKKRRYGGED